MNTKQILKLVNSKSKNYTIKIIFLSRWYSFTPISMQEGQNYGLELFLFYCF